MTRIYNSFFLLILGGLITISCTEVIQVELENTDEILVVDAWLNNLSKTQEIRLSLSQNYFDSDQSNVVDDAVVAIMRQDGREFLFPSMGNGIYQWIPSLGDSLGPVGIEFTLLIVWNGTSFTASSPLNRVPPIDSISQEFRTDEIFGPDGIYTEFFSRDPLGQGDVYWIKTYKNGEFLKKPIEMNIAYDAGFDSGTQIDGLIFIPPIRELTNRWPDDNGDDDFDTPPWQVGDEIRVDIHSIHEEAFSFLETARDQMTNGDNTIFAIPVANAVGNVRNDQTGQLVLGVFCVSAISTKSKIIE